ncbi:outer membrane protein assembly factor BamD [Bacteroidota bacterium]
MRLLRLNIVFLLFLPLLFSCSEYQKALKSDDFALKYELAKQQFNEEEYAKAVLLLEDILPFYRTSTEAEKVYYMYAYCQFAIGNNIIAAHHFKTLYDTYPYGKYSEQCLFNYAYCNYLESPPVNLDQSGSRIGIEAIQLFINKFPDSDKVEECNKYIDELNKKLENKAVYTAKLYYKLEDYKAAIWTINDVIDEYPLTDDRIELEYMILDSYHNLAIHSVESKKEERYKDVISFYDINKSKFQNSKYASQAENIHTNAKNSLKKIQ